MRAMKALLGGPERRGGGAGGGGTPEEERLRQRLRLRSECAAVDVFARLCSLERQAGYAERSVALFQVGSVLQCS